MDCLLCKDGTDRLFRNVATNYQHTPLNFAAKQRPELHHGGSLKSRNRLVRAKACVCVCVCVCVWVCGVFVCVCVCVCVCV